MVKTIIAISGTTGSGKSTTANELALNGFAIYNTGKLLREELIANKIVGRKEAYAKPTSAEVRMALIAWGQAKMHKNPAYWVKQMADEIDSHADRLIVYDDLRKQIELDYLRNRFGNQVKHLHLCTDEIDAKEAELFDIPYLQAKADFTLPAKRFTPEEIAHFLIYHAN